MAVEFWVDASGNILTDGSEQPLNCGFDPCCAVCVADLNFNYYCRVSFTWDGIEHTQEFSLFQDNVGPGWSNTALCDGVSYELDVYCEDEAWKFNLIKDGVNYGNPLTNEPGGATLISGVGNTIDVYGEITAGYYADDFPFCGKSGSFPSGDFLNDFHFHMTLA